MYLFRKRIAERTIAVVLDSQLYSANTKLFHFIFASFYQLKIGQPSNCNEPFLYLHLPSNIIFEIPSGSRSFTCDLLDEQWSYWMLYELEEWFAQRMHCTTFHASGIVLNGINTLILGNSLCGKSTLTAFLCCEKGADFLDDDSIYYFNKHCYGFHLPMALRNNIVDTSKWYICDTYDATHTRRKLVGYEQTVDSFSKIDLILFPEYNPTDVALQKIAGGNLFKKLMNHIRRSTDMASLFIDTNSIVENSIAYQISYTNCGTAIELLKSILKTL